ncbi:MAG: hypothetical protein KKA84_00040 [Bacteroidetes bacterium]|nr:hypothetical protein [Bacteroidota bacterium]
MTTCKDYDYDNPVDTSTILPAATRLTVSFSDDTLVTLSWQHSMISQCLFVAELSRDTGSWIELGQSDRGNFFQATYDFVRGVSYRFRIRAYFDVNESEYSNVVEAGIRPDPPVLVTPADNTTEKTAQLTLAWNTSEGAESYLLQVSESNTYEDLKINQNVGNISSKELAGLRDSTTYFWRVKATNKYGASSWSSTWNFNTSFFICGEPISYAGKTYNTVQIGNLCWLSENLDVGTMIEGRQQSSNNGIIEKYCYDNELANCETYGGLYQWNEAMGYSTIPGIQGICPEDWHIPTNTESQILIATVNNNGNALKAVGQGSRVGAGTNTIGFSALLGGFRNNNGVPGCFLYLHSRTYFWDSMESDDYNAYNIRLKNDNMIYTNAVEKVDGFSVRCVKD